MSEDRRHGLRKTRRNRPRPKHSLYGLRNPADLGLFEQPRFAREAPGPPPISAKERKAKQRAKAKRKAARASRRKNR